MRHLIHPMSRRVLVGALLAGLLTPIPAIAADADDESGGERVAIPGPKRTVAVSRFVTKSDFEFHYGLSDVGGGLSDLLTSALVRSGQFIVVERQTLADTLDEQKLGESGLVTTDGATRAGSLFGASLLIKGAVTEFNESAGGGGFGIGFAGIGVGVKTREATVGFDIQVVAAATGQVLASFPVRESISSRSFGVDLSRSGVDTGYSNFLQSAIGQAATKAVDRAIAQFVEAAAAWPWTGQVVAFDAGDVVINAGATSGIEVGDTFALQRSGRVFTDPATGRVLGQRTQPIGRAIVSAVEGEIAFADFVPNADAVPMRGDLVVAEQ